VAAKGEAGLGGIKRFQSEIVIKVGGGVLQPAFIAAIEQMEPPDSTSASTRSTVISGSSKAVSRVPGAPPIMAIEAVAGASNTTRLTPEARRSWTADPTLIPARSVIKLFMLPLYHFSCSGNRARMNPFKKG
jgi:hypothetical protein